MKVKEIGNLTKGPVYNQKGDTKQPPVTLPKGCKLLAETDKYVLAERVFHVNERERTEYITWRKQYDGSVALGHYFANNLQAAKEDFARRSELVEESRLFSPDEMAVVYKALMEYDRSDTIDYNDKKLLQHIESIRDKLNVVPDVDKYAKVEALIIEPEKQTEKSDPKASKKMPIAMKTFDLTWTRESYNGTFCALIIKAEDEATARAYFAEYKPDAKIVGISEGCDMKPGKPVLTVPEGWELKQAEKQSPEVESKMSIAERKKTFTAQSKAQSTDQSPGKEIVEKTR